MPAFLEMGASSQSHHEPRTTFGNAKRGSRSENNTDPSPLFSFTQISHDPLHFFSLWVNGKLERKGFLGKSNQDLMFTMKEKARKK